MQWKKQKGKVKCYGEIFNYLEKKIYICYDIKLKLDGIIQNDCSTC